MTTKVHLLDVGQAEYGDALLLRLGDMSVMIDGAHPGDQVAKGAHEAIPAQLARVLEQANPPYTVDLLIVTHAHADHIGCLPFLVANDLLRARSALVADPGLGWGRPVDAAPDFAGIDARSRQLVAALREETPSPRADDAALSALLADAADLETRYTQMLDALAAAGTNVVRHGRDKEDALVEAFAPVGLTIIGPGTNHLVACAALIAGATQDMLEAASTMFERDQPASLVDAYRRLTQPGSTDAAANRPGAAINLQSVVTTFEIEGSKLLFGGDMQWARPEVTDAPILDGIASMRAAIRAAAPFSFAKLSHHGSDNAFSPDIMADLGDTPAFGICAGEQSMAHPNPAVLQLLDQHRNAIVWARTDHNRSATFTFDGGTPTLEVAAGVSNDPVPNTIDAPVLAGATPGTPAGPLVAGAGITAGAVPVSVETSGTANEVTVVTHIPHVRTRVTITVDVAPGGAEAGPVADDPGPAAALSVGGGRALPSLLFVTNRDALVRNVGDLAATAALAAIEASGAALLDGVPIDPKAAVASVRQEIGKRRGVRGVVIVGGYDVVPSLILDCLPPALRASLSHIDDADRFFVWSDDPFGDADGDQIAELPVSRIPDAMSADLLTAALQATDAPRAIQRCGVRNLQREFADGIYEMLPNPRDFLVSAPATFDQAPAFRLDADRVYLMLHGDADDSARFWGEDPPNYPVAVAVSNVPNPAGRVAFAGCCWGALTVDRPAGRAAPGLPIAPKAPGTSVALSFLAGGATAFVGCTGTHYSPLSAPFDFYGGPMHTAFWREHLGGSPPAEALFKAKQQYATRMPHGQTDPVSRAIEFKIWREFTCLGLGW